jgi:LacI family transcriptional regulator
LVLVESSPVRCATVAPDHTSIGQVAAEYFLRRGYERIGFCGPEGTPFSVERCSAMREAVLAAGREFVQVRINIDEVDLRRLQFPMGVFASLLQIASSLTVTCRLAGVMVPEQLSILTVDNDEVAAGVTRPPLSTIEQNPQEVGYRAAELLHRILRGDVSSDTQMRIKPVGVVERQSTAALAVADPDVAAVLRHIHQHALSGLQAGEVFRAIPVARRSIEIRFRRLLGRTVQEEIGRVRLERARFLLTRTHLSIAAIAQQCGFSCQSDLSKGFARVYRTTPLRFRQEHRHGAVHPFLPADVTSAEPPLPHAR